MTDVIKEETNCMNTSTPVLPLVANGYGHDHHHGLEGKDAVLIHSNQTALNHTLNIDAVNRASKENVVESLNAKFEAERGQRDLEVRLMEAIVREGDKTRRDNFERDLARAERDRIDGKFLSLEKLIAGIGA